jgi:hypothetical protein
MAEAFAGLAMPPLTYSGAQVNMKVYCCASRHFWESSRRSSSSPIGNPQPARKTSWMEGLFANGVTSYATLCY